MAPLCVALKYGAAKNTLLKVERELENVGFPLTLQLFSALKKSGVEEIHQILDDWFNPEPIEEG